MRINLFLSLVGVAAIYYHSVVWTVELMTYFQNSKIRNRIKLISVFLVSIAISGCSAFREPGTSKQMKASYHPSRPYLVRANWADWQNDENELYSGGFEIVMQGDTWAFKKDGKYYSDSTFKNYIGEKNWPMSIYAIKRKDGATGPVIERVNLYPAPMPCGAYSVFERWHK